MNASTKTVSMARTAPRHSTIKDYSEFTVTGRKGKVDNRTKRNNRKAKRAWLEEN